MSSPPEARRQSRSVSSSFTAPARPSIPSSRAACHCNALRLCVCFPPVAAATAATGPESPRYGDTQIVNIAFDHDFVPTPDVHLSLHIRRHGPIESIYGPINTLPRVASFDLCNIGQTIRLVPATYPDRAIAVEPEPGKTPEPELEAHHHNQRRSPPPSRASSTYVALFLGALSLALAIILARTVHQTVSYWTQRPTVPPAPRNVTSPKPSPVCQTKRALPLPLFDDLVALTTRRANALLPLSVGAQSVVDQHYVAHSHPSRNSSSSDQRFDTPITIFFVHLLDSTTYLCDAVTHWTVLSESPIAEDINLLCTTIFSSVVNLPILWAETSSIMASPLHSTSIIALSSFLKVLKHFIDIEPNINHDTNTSSTDTKAYLSYPLGELYFYNATSYTILKSLKEMFFIDPSRTSELSRFSEVIYDAMRMVGSLERGIADLLNQLTLLSNIIRDTLIPILRAQKSKKKATLWFSKLPLQPSHRNYITEYTLADIAPQHKDLLSLISTTTTLTWIVGFAHQQLKHVTRDMEQLGNQTLDLVAVPPPPPPLSLSSPAASNPSSAVQDMSWYATPWVTATRDGTSKDGATCTFWYLPSAKDIVRSFENLLVWSAQEADLNELDYQWLCQAEQAWKW